MNIIGIIEIMKRNAVILNEKKMSRWDWARNDAEGIDPSEITDSSKNGRHGFMMTIAVASAS